ncbi:MAG: hypothetical protein LUI04_01795, partial [Porphyromonadaceae bacterium]|nr:hypothetical protein [Porphyromonadaceae bacterium]
WSKPLASAWFNLFFFFFRVGGVGCNPAPLPFMDDAINSVTNSVRITTTQTDFDHPFADSLD